MAKLSQRRLREMVHERAKAFCEYCHTSEDNTGQPMHVEHINPNGDNHLNNLCLSCASCNMSKAKAISALDVENNLIVRLFNPRIDEWNIHFAWSEDGLLIIGKTSTARATISRLKMNQERLLRARANWIIADTHPPK